MDGASIAVPYVSSSMLFVVCVLLSHRIMKTSTTSVAVAVVTASVVLACLSSPVYAFVFRSTVKGVQLSPMNVNNREATPVKLSRPQLSLNKRSRRVLSAGRRRCTSLLSGMACVAFGLDPSFFVCNILIAVVLCVW